MCTTYDIPAVLLVGGFGTRLRSVVKSRPKPLAAVGGKSFLGLLIRQLRNQGVRRVVMCSGYLADQIEQEFGDGSAWDVQVQYSREPEPLGTAGAIKLAQWALKDDSEFLVMNGDSFVELDLRQLIQVHRAAKALVTIAVISVEHAGRYGTVQVNSRKQVTGFIEKTGTDAPGLINAGAYVFSNSIFEHIPEGPASFEKNVFPSVLDLGVMACEQSGMFIDIGTPEDYARAQALSERLNDASSRR